MINPIKVVADRIVYWTQKNFPQYGPAAYSDYWSTLRVEGYKNLQYGHPSLLNIQEASLETSEFTNDGSLPNKQTFSVSKSTTDTFSWSLKEGISTKVSGKAGIPFLAEGSVEVTVSFESTQTQTNTNTRTWSYSTEVNVAPHKLVKTTFIVSEGNYSVPFTANVSVRGKVWIRFNSGRWWGGIEIDTLINNPNFNWRPDTFDYVMEGTLRANYGLDYKVKVVESALPSATATPKAETPSSTQVIDTGEPVYGGLQSSAASLELVSEKGPEQ